MRLHTEIFAFQVDERPGQRLFNIDCVLVTAETKRQLYFRNQILMAPTSVVWCTLGWLDYLYTRNFIDIRCNDLEMGILEAPFLLCWQNWPMRGQRKM